MKSAPGINVHIPMVRLARQSSNRDFSRERASDTATTRHHRALQMGNGSVTTPVPNSGIPGRAAGLAIQRPAIAVETARDVMAAQRAAKVARHLQQMEQLLEAQKARELGRIEDETAASTALAGSVTRPAQVRHRQARRVERG